MKRILITHLCLLCLPVFAQGRNLKAFPILETLATVGYHVVAETANEKRLSKFQKGNVLSDVEVIDPEVVVSRVFNLSELQATTGTKEAVYLMGRTTRDDGGHGVFVWESSDLSTEVAADTLHGIYVPPVSDETGTSGAWKRRFAGPILVDWFGPSGANDQLYINAAIDMVCAGYGVGPKLSKRTYTVGAPIVLKSGSDLHGEGWQSIIIGNAVSSFNRMITSSSTIQQSKIKIRNLKVDRSGTGTQHGIILGGIDGLLIENVWVYGYDTAEASGAIGISPFDDFADVESKNVMVQNCRIERANNFGIAFGFVTSGMVVNNSFVDCYRECIGIEGYDNNTPTGTDGDRQIVVIGNTISVNKTYGTGDGTIGPAILVGGTTSNGIVEDVIVSNNTISCGDFTGNDLDGTPFATYGGIQIVGAVANAAQNIQIINNIIRNTPGPGIALGAAGYLTYGNIIANNILVNPNTAGNLTGSLSGQAIHLRSAYDNIVKNNVVTGTGHLYLVGESEISAGKGNAILNNQGSDGTDGRYSLVGETTNLVDPILYQSARNDKP